MKHVSMMDYNDGSSLRDKVDEWILGNGGDRVLEIID